MLPFEFFRIKYKKMKKVILCFILLTKIIHGQVNDNFTDGDFSNTPTWAGDISQFEINSNHQLHLNSDSAGISFLSTPNERISMTSWSFWVKLSFNTSGNNFGRIYLVSDSYDLKKPLQGYFLQIGGSDDSIRFFRQNGDSVHSVYCFRKYKITHSTNILRFSILRDDMGNWEAFADTSGGTNFYKDGTFSENTISQTTWFGVFCKYTSSNSKKMYFDDFVVGIIIHDTAPPRILSYTIRDSLNLQLQFDENVNKETAEQTLHYYLKGSGQNPLRATLNSDSPSNVVLLFANPFTSGTFDSLRVNNVKDLAGNMIKDTTVGFCYYIPRSFDILIHEIMADPDPQVELPAEEFVELYNRTGFPLSLENWTFQFGKSVKKIPAVSIVPGGYLLLVKDSSWFISYGNCVPLFTSSFSLSNEGSTLVLRDKYGHIIHAISYEDTWLTSSFKKEGGWSMEMLDPMNPCGCKENWTESTDPSGGTPGRKNAVSLSHPDLQGPKIARAFIIDSLTIHVVFSEAIDSCSLLNCETYRIVPGEIHPDQVVLIEPYFDAVDLKFHSSFHKGIVYQVVVSEDIHDCVGNYLDTAKIAEVAIPMEISSGDIIINEILFNPYAGGSRFVELFNRSSKVLDVKSLILSKQDSSEGFENSGSPIIDESYLLFPFDFLCLSPDRDDVINRYPGPSDRKFIQPEKFPIFDNDSGVVVLVLRGDGSIIDKIRYSSAMHFPLLSSQEGVSLERLNPDRPSDDHTNWHSASESTGFATPAYQNSQFFPDDLFSSSIFLSPRVFSPDNDGHDDGVNLFIKPDVTGFQADVAIYDSRGRLVRKLAGNVLLSRENVFTWDGITDMNTKAALGIYIFFIDLLKADGTVKHFKRTVVLAGKL